MTTQSKSKVAVLSDTLRHSGLLWTLSLVLSRLGIRVLRWWPDQAINSDLLERQVGSILRHWGMAQEHITTTVKHISYADLHGIDSHGCSMLAHYQRQLDSGSITMTPQIQVIRESETTAVIEGGGGLGHVPADRAMALAIDKCRDAGVGIVTVRNSGHFGAAGAYVEMAAQAGMIGFAMTNVGNAALVPTHGMKAMLGTNPIAFSAPAHHNKPFLLDMATTVVPVGKLATASRAGRLIPSGWAYGKGLRITRNPDKAMAQRRLVPLGGSQETGGHKGYGLAAMVEILSSTLSGNCETQGGVGHFFLVIDPNRFVAAEAFGDHLDTMIDALRSSEPASPAQAVRVAGDPEYAAAQDHRENGIPLSQAVIEDIRMVCRRSGAPFLIEKEA